MIGLDTSACIDYLNGNSEIKKLIDKQEDMLCITAVTIYEVKIGLNRTKRKISEKRYNFLNKKWLEFLSGMEILSLKLKESEKAAEIFDVLESAGQIIDDNDILITGILLSNDVTKIFTGNAKHFSRIEQLSAISYST